MEYLIDVPFNWQAAACVLVVVMAVSFGLVAYLSRDDERGPPAPALEPEDPVTQPREVARRGANPIMRRVYERWLEAYRNGDRSTRLRLESRMVRSGFEPPDSEADCEAMIETLKGDRP